MPKIFICYRRWDTSDATTHIHACLEQQFGGDDVFMDVDIVPPGVDFRQCLHDAVTTCDVVLVVIGRDWLDCRDKDGNRRLDNPADFVRIELESALQRGIPVIPVLVRDASMPPEADLPESLRELVFRQAVEVHAAPYFRTDIDRLIRALERLTTQPERRVFAPQPAPQVPPIGKLTGPAGPVGRPADVITNSIGMKLVFISAGEFIMGSAESEMGRYPDEQQHLVRITRPFCLGAYQVTQAEYEQVMGKNPSHFRGATRPVETVSWNDAVEFCRKLSAREGQTYRLPTEAEWEYACRAATQTPFHFGGELNGREANCAGDYPYGTQITGPSLERTADVGSYPPNPCGLHDMHGNVWEWCQDRYGKHYYAGSPTEDPQGPSSGSYRVRRGGGWDSDAGDCRSANRYYASPGHEGRNLGFRVARSAVD